MTLDMGPKHAGSLFGHEGGYDTLSPFREPPRCCAGGVWRAPLTPFHHQECARTGTWVCGDVWAQLECCTAALRLRVDGRCTPQSQANPHARSE